MHACVCCKIFYDLLTLANCIFFPIHLFHHRSLHPFAIKVGCTIISASLYCCSYARTCPIPITSHIVFMFIQVSVGNHEANHQIGLPCPNNWAGEPLQFAPKWGNFGDDSQGEGGVGTFFRFKAPASTPGGIPSNSIFWYSFNIGALHFIQFSGEHDFTPGSRQYAWLSADLAAVNHSTTPWIVATVHRPMRNACEDSDFNVGQGMADALEALFLDGGVDLVLGGHYHLYQRTCNIRNGTCVANNTGPGRGMSHITVGSAGATTHNETITPGVPASWVAKYLPLVWGWGAVNVVNRSAMQWRFFSNELGIAAPLDEVWYYK